MEVQSSYNRVPMGLLVHSVMLPTHLIKPSDLESLCITSVFHSRIAIKCNSLNFCCVGSTTNPMDFLYSFSIRSFVSGSYISCIQIVRYLFLMTVSFSIQVGLGSSVPFGWLQRRVSTLLSTHWTWLDQQFHLLDMADTIMDQTRFLRTKMSPPDKPPHMQNLICLGRLCICFPRSPMTSLYGNICGYAYCCYLRSATTYGNVVMRWGNGMGIYMLWSFNGFVSSDVNNA